MRPRLGEPPLDVQEALAEAVRRRAQLALGIHAQLARQVHDREQQVADLARDRGRRVAGRASARSTSAVSSRTLASGPSASRPVEAHRGGLLLQAVGGDQRGQALGLVAEQRGGLVRVALLGLLDLLPLPVGGLAVLDDGVAVDVRVAADELVGGALEAPSAMPMPLRSPSSSRQKMHEEAEVAQLLGGVVGVTRGDRLDGLDRLLGQVGRHGLERLLAVPRAAVGAAQAAADAAPARRRLRVRGRSWARTLADPAGARIRAGRQARPAAATAPLRIARELALGQRRHREVVGPDRLAARRASSELSSETTTSGRGRERAPQQLEQADLLRVHARAAP